MVEQLSPYLASKMMPMPHAGLRPSTRDVMQGLWMADGTHRWMDAGLRLQVMQLPDAFESGPPAAHQLGLRMNGGPDSHAWRCYIRSDSWPMLLHSDCLAIRSLLRCPFQSLHYLIPTCYSTCLMRGNNPVSGARIACCTTCLQTASYSKSLSQLRVKTEELESRSI